MAFTIKKGDVIPLDTLKSGEGAKGVWAFVTVKADKGFDKIQLWCANAEEARYFTGEATIKDIRSVSISHTQSKDKTQWYTNYSADVVLDGKNGRKATADKGLNTFDDFMKIPDDDSGLPFA